MRVKDLVEFYFGEVTFYVEREKDYRKIKRKERS